MSSRDSILAAIAQNKPAPAPLPDLNHLGPAEDDLVEKFSTVAVSIGSRVLKVKDYREVQVHIRQQFGTGSRIISTVPELAGLGEAAELSADPHSFEDLELAVLKASFGVAENGAIWLTEDQMNQRVLPFIPQHLALIIPQDSLVANMHQAYDKIGEAGYGYGLFIAGPSKTADIEQSLVLGAHGPRSLIIFLMERETATSGKPE